MTSESLSGIWVSKKNQQWEKRTRTGLADTYYRAFRYVTDETSDRETNESAAAEDWTEIQQ
jgi:hypothetical protein